MLAAWALAGCSDRADAGPGARAVIGAGPVTLEPIPVGPSLSRLAFRPGSPPVWLGDDRIAVADRDAGQVVVLAFRTGASSRVGRRGQGPGEMLLPMWIVAGPGGSMVVGDGVGMRVTEFDADGKAGRMAQLPGRPLALTAWSGDTVTAVWIDGSQAVVGEVDLVTDAAVERFRPVAASPLVAASAAMPGGPSFFVVAASGGGDRTLVSGGWGYDVVAFDASGEAREVFSRPDATPELMTDEEFGDLSRAAEPALRAGGREMMRHGQAFLQQMRARPKAFFGMGGLAVDGRGRLWVVTSHRTGSATAVDVFSPDGTFLTRLEVPGRVRSVAPRLPYLAVLRETVGGAGDGSEGLDVYRVGG